MQYFITLLYIDNATQLVSKLTLCSIEASMCDHKETVLKLVGTAVSGQSLHSIQIQPHPLYSLSTVYITSHYMMQSRTNVMI